MRAYAFLGAAQFGYQADVVEQLRARGVDVDPLVEGSLDDLEAIAAAGPALLFLCGLPYTRLRDAFGADLYVGQNELDGTRYFVPRAKRANLE